MYLQSNIYSTCTRKLYGSAGTEVKVVADHGNVMIVEDAVGFRFPVPTDNLVEDKEDATYEAPPPVINTVPSKVQKKKVSVTTQSLF